MLIFAFAQDNAVREIMGLPTKSSFGKKHEQ